MYSLHSTFSTAEYYWNYYYLWHKSFVLKIFTLYFNIHFVLCSYSKSTLFILLYSCPTLFYFDPLCLQSPGPLMQASLYRPKWPLPPLQVPQQVWCDVIGQSKLWLPSTVLRRLVSLCVLPVCCSWFDVEQSVICVVHISAHLDLSQRCRFNHHVTVVTIVIIFCELFSEHPVR